METMHKNVRGVMAHPNSLLAHPAFVQTFMSIAAAPDDLEQYFKLEQVMKQIVGVNTSEYFEQLQLCPGAAEMIQQRYVGPKYKLEDLKECAPGTLGNAYYHHMTNNGISLDPYTVFESPDDMSYIKLREMQTHDIWHVVTGYKPDTLGELALQGFYHGQNPAVYQTLVMLAITLHYAAVETKLLKLALDALFEGWQRGRAARQLWPVRWEEMWDQPLEEIRAEYNVLPTHVLN